MGLNLQPYKGARDFYPPDMQVQNYIFDVWRKSCESFGFEEYSFPIIESFDLFAAKSGEEIVKEQLYSFEDKGGRKLAIRPELTPSTVRMIAKKYKELTKPTKWFMIGNNWRFEKPQTGRGREFYQLEANIFGVESIEADFEIFKLINYIMTSFGASSHMYEIRFSDRRLVNSLLEEVLELNDNNIRREVRRIMDKRNKISKEDFNCELQKLGLNQKQISQIEAFLSSSIENINVPANNEGVNSILHLLELINKSKFEAEVVFDPSVVRGFDYSDTLVYEVFDKNPKNKRSLFGGERFNRLIKIFGDYELAATGFAMGDYTLLEFLKNWGLLPKFENTIDYLVTVWPSNTDNYFLKSMEVAQRLRKEGSKVFCWLDKNTPIDKQLKYASKKGAKRVVIVGEEEILGNFITIKDLRTREQFTQSL